jgi:hypothetical protein
MKKFLLLLCLGISISMIATEKRIYFAYTSKSDVKLPEQEGLTVVNYRCGNGFKINNWNNLAGPWNPATGGYVLGGTEGYRQYGFTTTKSSFSVIHHIEGPTTTEKIADLSEVTKDWTFHIAIKTNYAGKLEFTIQDKNATQFTIDITDKVTKRDLTWGEVEISMDDFITATGIDFKQCIYSSLETTGARRDMWIIKGTEVTADGNIGWDDCYLTDNGSLAPAGIIQTSEKPTIQRTGNFLNAIEGNMGITVYNVAGASILSTKENTVDISALKAVVYFSKSNGYTLKFVK